MGNFKDVCRYRVAVIMVYDDKITPILYIQHVDADDVCCFSPLQLPERHVKRKKMCNSSIKKKGAVMFGLVPKASKTDIKVWIPPDWCLFP